MPKLTLSDKLLVHLKPNRELCHAVLADCLLIKLPSDAPFLLPEHFPMYTDRAVWKAMLELEKAGLPIEQITLKQMLLRDASVSDISDIDWDIYFTRVLSEPNQHSALTFEQDARFIFDCALRRQKAHELEAQIDAVFDLTVPLPESGLVNMKGVVHTLAEAYEDLPPVNWLVENRLAPGCVVLLYGKPATKKTYSMFALGSCVANGKDWLGFKTRKAAVLYIDQESGDRRIRMRVRECQNGVGGDKTAPIVWVTMQGYKLSNKADIAKIKQIKIEHHIELIIIDSLSKHTEGDENSAADMSAAMDGARELAHDPEAAVLLIHHSQKTGEQFRGSSSIEGSVDMMIRVESDQGSAFVNFTMEKNRDGELLKWSARVHWVRLEGEPEKDQFYMERVENQKVESGERRMGAKEHIVAYLKEHGESSITALVASTQEFAEAAIRTAVQRLEKAGTICRTEPTGIGNARIIRYILSEPEIASEEE